MKKTADRSLVPFAISVAAFVVAAPGATSALAAESIMDALNESSPILNARLRYEYVDQAGLVNDANALTMRVRFGFQTGTYLGLSLLAETEATVAFNDNYNSTTNGKGTFPVVADPESKEINRLFLRYETDGVTATVGRQAIKLDNARFIGDVGWRQNQQTFDAALLEVTAIDDLTLTYGYIDSVRRIFGSESVNRSFDSDSHIVNVSYAGISDVGVTAYAYLLDLTEAPALSTATYGGRVSGSVPLGDLKPLSLAAEYANQSDYGNNPGSFDLDYYHLTAGSGFGDFSVSAGYEVLEGNGTVGFSTPLATVHAFQGWADGFLATPANGIEDLYGQIGYTFHDVGPLPKVITKAVYHDFSNERTGTDLGDEIDLLIKAVINPNLSATAKFASLDGTSAGPADREKVWVQLDFKL